MFELALPGADDGKRGDVAEAHLIAEDAVHAAVMHMRRKREPAQLVV